MGIEEQSAVVDVQPLLDFYIHSNGPTQGHLIDFRFSCNTCMLKRHTRVYNVATSLDCNFLIIAVWHDREQSAVSPQRSTIGLNFEPYICLEKVPIRRVFPNLVIHIYAHHRFCRAQQGVFPPSKFFWAR